VDGHYGGPCRSLRLDVGPGAGAHGHGAPHRLAAGVRVDPEGPNGKTLEVDELGEISLCVRPDHLDLKTKRANVNKRGPTRGPNKRPS
jgi:hypothetical protein